MGLNRILDPSKCARGTALDDGCPRHRTECQKRCAYLQGRQTDMEMVQGTAMMQLNKGKLLPSLDAYVVL